jgi:hypothetical protein
MAICHGLTRFIYDADNIRIVLQSGHCTYPDSNNGARGLHKLYAKLFLSYKVNITSVIKIFLYGTPLSGKTRLKVSLFNYLKLIYFIVKKFLFCLP